MVFDIIRTNVIKICYIIVCTDGTGTESDKANADSPKKSKNVSSSNGSDGKKDSNAGIDPGYESSRIGEETGPAKNQQQQAHKDNHGDKQPGTFAGTNAEHKSLLLGPQGTGREGELKTEALIFKRKKILNSCF